MGLEYALVHLKYTIPPAIALTLLYRPLLTPLALYKVLFLISVAVVSTIPWDSYLIRHKIWTYPKSVILGPTLWSIPVEELFFFIIQTYNTTFLYLILSKPLLHSVYLEKSNRPFQTLQALVGKAFFAACTIGGGILANNGGNGTYLGLILVWAGPFALLLWVLSSAFLLRLPLTSTFVPIVVPTLYLWIVDTLALRRGTWSIETGTKLGIHVWDGLEIEEAIFFLATNTLIVFGLVAFDHAVAILLTFPKLFPEVPELPSPVMLVQALLRPASQHDDSRVNGIRQAVERLQKKSRSFYLASSTFSGRLRIDLILLYSFCRVADDLVDNCSSQVEAREWTKKLARYLDLAYASKERRIVSEDADIHAFILENFPASSQAALCLLPTHILSYGPLYDLLEGFKTDLEFQDGKEVSKSLEHFPISTEHDLETYAARVAGTVAELCLELVFHHSPTGSTNPQRDDLVRAGGRMGMALQYVNISRDIATDAAIGRVYIPTSWLKEDSLVPGDILEHPSSDTVEELRTKLLSKAFGVYKKSYDAIAHLPPCARAPMRVAVESYMEIGRVLTEKGYSVKNGKATVPKIRRLRVAWKALSKQ